MILLNFSHPITDEQIDAIQKMTGERVDEVIRIPVHFDTSKPFYDQLLEALGAVRFTPEEWQTKPILVNPPAQSVIASILLAELHGRMGYFPTIVRISPVEGSAPPKFAVAEIVNLQGIRDKARGKR